MKAINSPRKLELRDVSDRKDRDDAILRNLTLELVKGKILGVMGSSVSGKSEFGAACAGRRKVRGEVLLNGEKLQTLKSETILEEIGYIPKDLRKGLVESFTVAENLTVGSQHKKPFSKRGILNQSHIENYATKLVKEYRIEPPDISLETAEFSGGNKKKILVGREISKSPEVLIAENPTAGLDIGMSELIWKKMEQLKKQKTSIILITEEFDEVKRLSDRIIVFYNGQIVGSGKPSKLTRDEIGRLMLGEK